MKLNKKTNIAIRKYKEYRNNTLTKSKPCKKLTYNLKRNYGRNNTGKITVRHKMRGAKRLYREISFVRKIYDKPCVVKSVEYDPNRSAFISLIQSEDNEVEYIIHVENLKVGDVVTCSKQLVANKPGNCTVLKNIPVNTFIHCVELYPGRGAVIARSAGSYAEIIGQEDKKYTLVQLRSGVVMKIFNMCMANIGVVSNKLHNSCPLYKAGQTARKGIRPEVRGTAMNPHAHPHGGGKSRTGTKRIPVGYRGAFAKGNKTANKKGNRKNLIIRSRKYKK